jgi:hypothetical protein
MDTKALVVVSSVRIKALNLAHVAMITDCRLTSNYH